MHIRISLATSVASTAVPEGTASRRVRPPPDPPRIGREQCRGKCEKVGCRKRGIDRGRPEGIPFRAPQGIRPQPLRCRSWGSAIMRANLAQRIRYRVATEAGEDHPPPPSRETEGGHPLPPSQEAREATHYRIETLRTEILAESNPEKLVPAGLKLNAAAEA